MTTITSPQLEQIAATVRKMDINLCRDLVKSADITADMLANTLEIIDAEEQRRERERLARQAWNAKFHPNPVMRHYARTERRVEMAHPDTPAELEAEMREAKRDLWDSMHDR